MKVNVQDQRSCCPVATSLDIVGDKWTLLVIRDLLVGKQRFDEFLKSPEGIATNILSQRLRWLVENGLAQRTPDPKDGRKVTYSLTEQGEGLKIVLKAMADWGMNSLKNVQIHPDYASSVSAK
ncbi:MAG TPA: transcriptional regulator [Opitutae bacterium]|nr:transcriptional regulator [Opitutae bacterium]